MLVVVTLVSLLVQVYSISYMKGHKRFGLYFAYTNLFTFMMLLLVVANNMLQFFVGWEGVGLCSYLLIGFWFEDAEKAKAGMKAFVVNRIGDAGFLGAIFLIFGVMSAAGIDPQAGAFNFGVFAGCVHGVLGALGMPMSLVSPGVWKPAMGLRRGLNESQAQNKTRARSLAIKLWPEKASEFARVKDDGRAESVLIARYHITKKGW